MNTLEQQNAELERQTAELAAKLKAGDDLLALLKGEKQSHQLSQAQFADMVRGRDEASLKTVYAKAPSLQSEFRSEAAFLAYARRADRLFPKPASQPKYDNAALTAMCAGKTDEQLASMFAGDSALQAEFETASALKKFVEMSAAGKIRL